MSSTTNTFHHPVPLVAPSPDEVGALLCNQGFVRLDAAGLVALTGQVPDALAGLTQAWQDLPSDTHLKDGGRYRRRRHGSYIQDLDRRTLSCVPHRPHWQPTTYNALHGGMLRWFEPLGAALATAPAFLALIGSLGELVARAVHRTEAEPAFDGRWFIEAHPFRIDTTGGVGRPTPEGAHRDGVNFVAVLLVDRHAVRGGESRVFAADGPEGVRFTLEEPWSVLLLDDDRVIHETTPIQPALAEETGWRDTLVLTYRAGAFQDPPGT
ncbi:MAG: 2OG-Fe dioxygenase family protein [Leptothrix sp. (in: Bacteria)]|nr:2OG-Fe dioxygenase family protein [Leptothrix sp. (in: b-proteobacteria)]